ncbi:MAG: thioredoxin domain-containing protein, partial [Chloroflexota bacterium]
MFKRGFPALMLLVVMMLASCASVPSEPAAIIPVAKDNLTFIHFFSDECPNCMVMIPIVDKLAARYSQQMTFETLNVDT